jgi:hypothetical protein
MKTLFTGTLLALTMAAGQAFAQTTPTPTTPSAPAAQPATPSAPAGDAEAKFKAADKNNSGMLETTETDAYKAVLAKVDANKDGKISREEFMAGSKAGHIK